MKLTGLFSFHKLVRSTPRMLLLRGGLLFAFMVAGAAEAQVLADLPSGYQIPKLIFWLVAFVVFGETFLLLFLVSTRRSGQSTNSSNSEETIAISSADGSVDEGETVDLGQVDDSPDIGRWFDQLPFGLWLVHTNHDCSLQPLKCKGWPQPDSERDQQQDRLLLQSLVSAESWQTIQVFLKTHGSAGDTNSTLWVKLTPHGEFPDAGMALLLPLQQHNMLLMCGFDSLPNDEEDESSQQSQSELERFSRLAVGRELRMLELKQEINELLQQRGEEPRYRTDFEDEWSDQMELATIQRSENNPTTAEVSHEKSSGC